MIKRTLPARRSNIVTEPISPLGIALKNARVSKQLPQRVIAEALAEKCGGEPTNVRVSQFELSRKLPTDAELTVMAQVLGLSVQTLRQKREASREHREARGKELYERQIERGQKTRLKPVAAKKPATVAPKKPAPMLALAELVEQIDEIAPMPADKDARRRWFTCVSELSRIGAAS